MDHSFEVVLIGGDGLPLRTFPAAPNIRNELYLMRNIGIDTLVSRLIRQGISAIAIHHVQELMKRASLRDILERFVTVNTKIVGLSTSLLYARWDPRYAECANLDEVVRDFNGYLVGKNVTSCELVLEMADIVKSISPGAKIIIGGHSSSWFNEHRNDELGALLQRTAGVVDVMFNGTAEHSLVKYFQEISNGASPPLDRAIGGFATISETLEEKKSFTECGVSYGANSHLPYGAHLNIELSRGCNFRCRFCRINANFLKPSEYTKSPSVLKDELTRNYEEHGVTSYFLGDDMVNDSDYKVRMLTDVIGSLPFSVKWGSFARLDPFIKNPEHANMMKESGCIGLTFGVETFNSRAGASVGKGLGERSKEVLTDIRSRVGDDVFLQGCFIAGLPYEDPYDLSRSIVSWMDTPDCALDAMSCFPLYIFSMEEWKNYGYRFIAPNVWARENDTLYDAYQAAALTHRTASKIPMTMFLFHPANALMLGDLGVDLEMLLTLKRTMKAADFASAESQCQRISEIGKRGQVKWYDDYCNAVLG